MKIPKIFVSVGALITGIGLGCAVKEMIDYVPPLSVERMQACLDALQSGQVVTDPSYSDTRSAETRGVHCERSKGPDEFYGGKADAVVFVRNIRPFGGQEIYIRRATNPDGVPHIETFMTFLSKDGKISYDVGSEEPVAGYPYPKGGKAITDKIAPEDEGTRQRMAGMLAAMQEKVVPSFR